MTCNEINIRDPFVLHEDGIYYMYGTRANNFGRQTGGFDVYTSKDLETWSEPIECFNSIPFGMNQGANWAPEVHKYNNTYYMFATFVQKNGLRGTYVLKSESPFGPFLPHSQGAITPPEWECLDGTLYIDQNNTPYLVFCHEHTQIVDGTICYAQLRDDLSERICEPVTIFAASACPWVDKIDATEHFVTDGPFLYQTHTGELLMLWSSLVKGQYAELLVKFNDRKLSTNISHLPPLIANDGGHGMLFQVESQLYFTFHCPNKSGYEHPCFVPIFDVGHTLRLGSVL